jgi:DNA ligase-1
MDNLGWVYKRDENGNVRQWMIEINGDKYRTISGVQGGKLVTSEWTVCEAKNVGRSNNTTPEEQAYAQAASLYKKKLDKEYHININDIDEAKIYKPMLAVKWNDIKDKLTYPVFVQPKLDGVRCIANRKGLWTRNGKPIVSVPHIFESLKHLFKDNPDMVLDGELYNHDLKDNFNEIISLSRKTKPTLEDLEQSSKYIQYHVYDVPSVDGVFSKRFTYLSSLSPIGCVRLVETGISLNEEHISEAHALYTTDGYEGTMVRQDKPYEQKRSKHLIKYKDFEDSEFTIVRIEEGQGNWSGYAKRVIVQNDDGETEFGAGIAGTQEFCRQLLEEADEYVGGQVTIHYFTRTPDGVPRFPVAKTFYKDKRDM